MNSTVKTVLIVGGVAAAAYVGWMLWKRSQANAVVVTVPGGQTVNNAAPQDKTAQIINAGSAAISKITDFFN